MIARVTIGKVIIKSVETDKANIIDIIMLNAIKPIYTVRKDFWILEKILYT